MDVARQVLEADGRIRPQVRETPVDFSPCLSQAGQCRVHLKLENLQSTGSFKLRGALNKLLSLSEAERRRGIVTASSGNHGAAVAYLLQEFNCPGRIYLLENAAPAKVEALRSYGAELTFVGTDCLQAELRAKKEAGERSQVYVSPYNDPAVVGGQGTVGLELARQVAGLEAVLVPVGGGGLIAGLAGYLKSVRDSIEIIGCQPENSAVMVESLRAGRILNLDSKPTLSDGTAGGIEPGAITFELCRRWVDDFVLVTEDEIKAALRLILEKHHMLIEGAAALSVAAFLKAGTRFKGRSVALVLSGARLGLPDLQEVLRTAAG
ncbi:MAG: threonine/serine dehydratase [Terriglobia bacterium]